MAAAVLRLQPPDKPITSRPRLEGPLNGIALIWVAVVYRLLAQLKDHPPHPPLTREIDDTQQRETSTAPRPVQPEGFEGRPSRGRRSYVEGKCFYGGVCRAVTSSSCMEAAWRSSCK